MTGRGGGRGRGNWRCAGKRPSKVPVKAATAHSKPTLPSEGCYVTIANCELKEQVDLNDVAVFYFEARPACLKHGFYDVSGVCSPNYEHEPHKDVAEFVEALQEQPDNNTRGAGTPGSSVMIIYR